MSTPQFTAFLSALNSCKQQAIFWHNQTTSYSTHKTLNEFYDEILELLDGLVESVAGIYGRPTGYTAHDPEDYTSVDAVIEYFKKLFDYIQTERANIYQDSWIQNQIDEITQLVASTLYLLSLNK
jgi:hypothetical protein